MSKRETEDELQVSAIKSPYQTELGAGAMAGGVAPKESQQTFDVALSFAGTERPVAEKLATIVRDAGLCVFYDEFYQEQLWGEDLAECFELIYRDQSRYCVIFKSHEYLERMWTIHERRSAVARLLQERGKSYVLPIEVERVNLPGIPPTVGHVSLSRYSIEQIAAMLISKLTSRTA